jgi:hypothetical protein
MRLFDEGECEILRDEDVTGMGHAFDCDRRPLTDLNLQMS